MTWFAKVGSFSTCEEVHFHFPKYLVICIIARDIVIQFSEFVCV